MNNDKGIVIFTAKTAKYLLRHNQRIIDVKPDKHNKDRSVFVFELTDNIKDLIRQHTNEEKENEKKNIR